MKIEWTNTFTVDFDLEQAVEDFRSILEWNHETDPDSAIYHAVEANWECDGEEYIDTTPGIELAAKVLRETIGGIQMKMELN